MATSRLSKEAEVKITNSLSEIAELVNSGANPNEAIAKTASANGIPVGHVELMVRAFNVGRSEAQRQSGAEPHEKLAEFELADPKSVMDIMYPSNVKSASVLSKDSSVSNVYAKAPLAPSRAILPELPPLIKNASASDNLKKDTLGEIRQLSSLIEKIGSASTKLRSDSVQARDKVTAGINKLANYFRSYGNKPFMVVKDNSERLFGKKASALLDILLTSNRHLKKQAGTTSDMMEPVNIDEEPYKSIKSCIDLAKIHLNKEASSAYLSGLAKQAISAGFYPEGNDNSVLSGIGKEAGILDVATVARRPIAGLNAIQQGYKSTAPNESQDWKFQADQRLQEMQLKNIRTSAALADLMANDEVISAAHPEDVTYHFNELSQLMPESASNTAIIRPLLRKRLEGGAAAIDPYDVQTALTLSDLHKPRAKSAAWGEGIINPSGLRSPSRDSKSVSDLLAEARAKREEGIARRKDDEERRQRKKEHEEDRAYDLKKRKEQDDKQKEKTPEKKKPTLSERSPIIRGISNLFKNKPAEEKEKSYSPFPTPKTPAGAATPEQLGLNKGYGSSKLDLDFGAGNSLFSPERRVDVSNPKSLPGVTVKSPASELANLMSSVAKVSPYEMSFGPAPVVIDPSAMASSATPMSTGTESYAGGSKSKKVEAPPYRPAASIKPGKEKAQDAKASVSDVSPYDITFNPDK